MNTHTALDDNHKFEASVFRKLNAFLMLKEEGFEAACIMYPDDVQFLSENKEKTYQRIRGELFRQLERV